MTFFCNNSTFFLLLTCIRSKYCSSVCSGNFPFQKQHFLLFIVGLTACSGENILVSQAKTQRKNKSKFEVQLSQQISSWSETAKLQREKRLQKENPFEGHKNDISSPIWLSYCPLKERSFLQVVFKKNAAPPPKVSFRGRTTLLAGRSEFGCDWTFTVQLFYMIFKL